MYVERFPRRAWMKQLRRMALEAASWESKYRRTGSVAENDGFADRCIRRADILAGVVVQLENLVQGLDELPRLK